MKKREGRSTEALSSQGSEKSQKVERGGLVHVKPTWICCLVRVKVGLRLGDRDPIFKYWPEQTIGFKGAYSFLRQALQGCDFELLEATSAFVTSLGGKVNTYLSGELRGAWFKFGQDENFVILQDITNSLCCPDWLTIDL